MSISRSRSGSVYAGTVCGLRADVSFSDSSAVDVNISLDISWSRGSDVIANDTHTVISPVSDSGDSYIASLTYTPIATSDGGQFTATVTVRPPDGIIYMYIETPGSVISDSVTVIVTSKLKKNKEYMQYMQIIAFRMMCVPPSVRSPVMTVSGPVESELVAGSSLSLTCSM